MSSQMVRIRNSGARAFLTNYSGGLAIVYAAAAASLLLVLSGCGSGAAFIPAPGANLSTNNLDFGSWKLSTTSASEQLTLTNGGSATLTISGVTLGGTNASAFTMNNGCGASLSPGSSCAITVTFTPPGTSSVSASITITDNADNSPQTVGLSGSGSTLSGVAHGMFMLDPPNGDSNCNSPFPSNCYSGHLLPTFICSGPGTPVLVGYNCTAQGAGWPTIDGAVFQIPWSVINPSNGAFSFSGSANAPDDRIQDWADSGKLVGLVFEPTSFGTASVANGNPNNATPGWYINPVAATISQTGGIIEVQNASGFAFLPGGVSDSAGLEIQITGTGSALDSTSSNAGIYTICNQSHSGCQNPNSNVIYAIGSGGAVGPVSGMVGNPVFGSADGSICTSGILPIEWRPNFIKAWQAVIQSAVQYYGSNRSIAYMRFGMGVGGQTEPTNGLSSFDPNPTACQQQMTEFGFTPVAAPWPNPGDSSWSQVSENWITYLDSMLKYEQSLNSTHALVLTLSPILYGEPEDTTTINATAANAATTGIGIGNQGLDQTDASNYSQGQACYGGNWCANFPKYADKVATTEQQTLSDSSPSGQTSSNMTGSLAGPPNLLTFATSLDTRILELYFDDWMCTFDTSWNGQNSYSACKDAGYPAAFNAAAAQIN
jgi:hypothetical protein